MPIPPPAEGQHRLRTGRVSLPGHAYHITMNTYGRLPIFKDFDVTRAIIGQMRVMHDAGWLQSLAWVLMPDHLHWLLILGESALPATVNRFKSGSAHAANQCLQRKGAIWQVGYHDHGLRHDEDLKNVARYIVANPVRAGLYQTVGDYPHWDAVWI